MTRTLPTRLLAACEQTCEIEDCHGGRVATVNGIGVCERCRQEFTSESFGAVFFGGRWHGVRGSRRGDGGTMTASHVLPPHLYTAYEWISAAGEWTEALQEPTVYAQEAAANAAENKQTDVHEGDLLEAIEWFRAAKQV